MTNTVVLPKRKRRPVDKTLPVIMTLLLMMGLVTLFSATYYNAQDGGDALSEVKKQLFGMAVGFAAMLFTSRIPYWFWGRHRVALAGLGLSAVLLVLVIIPGVGVYINGSRRWLRLGPLSFQPSELAKYAVVLFVALALAARGKRVQRFFTGILPVLIAPGVMFLLILEQPNLSTAGTIIIVSVILVMLAGARWRHMLVLGAGGLALGAYYAWSEPYRRERLRQQMEQARTASEQKPSQEEEPSSEETSTGASANPTLASESASSATSYSVRLPSEYLLNSTIRLFHQIGQIFRENAAPPSNPMGIRIDSKRRKKLMQKRLAMGHKQDDHEQNYGQTLQ